ncbi:MAG: peptide deformylase [Nodosilinea sp.]
MYSPHRSLVTLGDPRLRWRAQPIATIDDPSLQALIEQLLATVQTASGVGIAAPQMGWSIRLLVVASRPNLRYPNAPVMTPTVVINPQILSLSDEVEKGWEGCLSVPGVRGNVPRHQQVEVAYTDRFGQSQRQVWQGFVARIFQHEYDHLEGKVFLDRVEQETDLLAEAAYQAMVIESL